MSLYPIPYGQAFYVSQQQHFLKILVSIIKNHSWDYLVLPHSCLVGWLKEEISAQSDALVLPKVITLDHPLGYEHSTLISENPLSFGQALAWTIHFLHTHYPHFSFQAKGVAEILVRLWQNITDDAIWEILQQDTLTTHHYGYKMGEILTQWAKWWPTWLKENGYCSMQYARDQAMKQLLNRFRISPPSQGVLVAGSVQCPSFLMWVKQMKALSRSLVLFPSPPPAWDEALTPWPYDQNVNQSAAFVGPQDLVCTSASEQAKIIALLVRESLAQQGNEKIALVNLSAPLLDQVHLELKRWHIDSPRSDVPLLSTLLLKIFKGTRKQWPFNHLVALARHPLVLKAYPIGLAMAAWADRFGELSHDAQPLWMRKSIQRLHSATLPLHEAIIANHPLPLREWLNIHVQAVTHLIPHLLSDSDFILEKLIQETLYSPALLPSDYEYWLETILTGIQKSQPCHQRIVKCAPEYLSFLSPHRCIIVPSPSIDPFPWVPQEVKKVLAPSTADSLEGWCAPEQFTVSCTTEATEKASLYHSWAQNDAFPTAEPGAPISRPPLPCLSRVSISDLHLWLKDFDSFYWRRILKIQPPRLSFHQIWGMAIHTVLDRWIKECPPCLKVPYPEFKHRLQELALDVLPPLDWVQTHLCMGMLEKIALCEWEKRSQEKYTSRTEVWGRLHFSFPEGAVTLIARADRIDYLEDGTAHIIDYKTGAVPSFVDIDRMKAVQLPLEALMLQQGGFDQQPVQVSQMSWWHIGLSQGCRIKTYPRALAPVLASYEAQLPLWLHQFVCGTYEAKTS